MTSPRPRPILAAVDFSTDSERAARVALARAARSGAALHLVHVDPSPEVATAIFGEPLQIPRELLEKVLGGRQACTEKLAALAAALRREAPDVALTEHHAFAEPGAGILEQARRIQAGTIVMATRGSGATQFLLGSVTAHVVQRAPCPVLVTDRGAGPAAPSEFRRVLCGIDEATGAGAIVREAARFAAPDGVIELVHAWHAPHLGWLRAAADRGVVEAAAAEAANARLRAHAADVADHGRKVETWAGRGSPAGVLLDRARDTRADLLVVGAHRRHGAERVLGTNADRVLRFATSAVLVVPGPAPGSRDAA